MATKTRNGLTGGFIVKIITHVLGLVGTNCYFAVNEQTNECIIIDPADDAGFICDECERMRLTPVAVLLTHCHFDHILAAEGIRKTFNIAILIGEKDLASLMDPETNGSALLTRRKFTLTADRGLADNEVIALAGFQVKIMQTPGHTTGSVCYYMENEKTIFTGDTLFKDGIGRTDLPTGDINALAESIKNKLLILPPETAAYPGHGGSTSLGGEKNVLRRFGLDDNYDEL
jgi:glyoxylase-like metal-dependent hydrolase (beta-lactamase superfamily II)